MLEKNGALLTWSINDVSPLRKSGGISPSKEFPPHRIVYLTYQGKISRGRGSVKIYDKGRYDLIRESEPLLVKLEGKILKGCYCLVCGVKGYWWIMKT
ncbi:MAG: hypothetical protein HY811_11130 [Planctomycetes bacterium]|nr:hypothetical protein [Planctomycetota bacterium]